jgi:hypothetical protein
MNDQKYMINKLDDNISNIYTDFEILKDTLKKNDMTVAKLSHLSDLIEITEILNEKLIYLNDKIEMDSLTVSCQAVKRINNNKIVLEMLKPFIPYMLLHLDRLNNT